MDKHAKVGRAFHSLAVGLPAQTDLVSLLHILCYKCAFLSSDFVHRSVKPLWTSRAKWGYCERGSCESRQSSETDYGARSSSVGCQWYWSVLVWVTHHLPLSRNLLLSQGWCSLAVTLVHGWQKWAGHIQGCKAWGWKSGTLIQDSAVLCFFLKKKMW